MIIDWSQNLRHLLWAEQQLQVRFGRGKTTWLSSLDDKGNLLGVVVYTNYSRTNCEMSVAAESPAFLNRRALKAFFGYPFNQLGCCRVTAVAASDNTVSYNFLRRLGFSVEGCLRKWFGSTDGLALGLLKEECKWL